MSAIAKSVARAVADVGEGRILATVEIGAPVERVYRAITTGDDITQWWGSPETYRTTEWTADVRPGGRWRASGVGADGKAFSVEGEFSVVNPPHKLVQTWKPAWDGGHETTLTYLLDRIDGGTRLTLRHEGFSDRVESCRGHAEGWERVLEWLTKYVARAAQRARTETEERYFFCRLLPPRPTFAADMDAAEAEVMRQHAQYWRGLMDRGVAIVFGPVADPAGPWGLGVLRTSSEESLRELRDGDPAIRSGRGFRYETTPMIRAVTRS
jgi:uncharacterized protein YndB with AHSA1/START domain